MSTELLTPILNFESPDVNFFEGRLLSGKDLREQHQAYQARFKELGKAVGAGVIDGLEVKLVDKGSATASPVLKVKTGAALNSEGRILELESDHDLTLAITKNASRFRRVGLGRHLPFADGADFRL